VGAGRSDPVIKFESRRRDAIEGETPLDRNHETTTRARRQQKRDAITPRARRNRRRDAAVQKPRNQNVSETPVKVRRDHIKSETQPKARRSCTEKDDKINEIRKGETC